MGEIFTIRMATKDDYAIIVHHRRAMFEAMGHNDLALLDAMTAAATVWIQHKLANGEYLAWFAVNEREEVVAGVGLWLMDWIPHVLDIKGQRAYVLNVFTEAAYRKQGLARRLMQTLMVWCDAQKINVTTLHASDEGRPLYEQLGFTASNEMRRYISYS